MTHQPNQQPASISKLFRPLDLSNLIDSQNGDFCDQFATNQHSFCYVTTIKSMNKTTPTEQIGNIEYYAPNEDGVYLFD
ncbi:MAG: hypothetical protein U0Y10_14215 [Spirosomataceae bacterium]